MTEHTELNDPLWRVLRTVLFTLDPERAHDVALAALDRPGMARWLGRRVPVGAPLSCMGLDFPNRIGLAAGLDKNGDHIDALASLGFGHVEVGTVTPRAQPGNDRPRLFRLARHGALINRMGFNNKGVAHLVAQAEQRRSTIPLGINIGKNATTPNEQAADDYLQCLEAVWPVADYVSVNISSPNTTGLRDLQHGEALRRLLDAIGERASVLSTRHGRHVPIALKIAPDLDDSELDDVVDALDGRPIAALIVGNTTRTRSGCESDSQASETGGLSGRPLASLADDRLDAAHRRSSGSGMALIGVGGVDSGLAAARKCERGADLVQIYTGFIYHGPALVRAAIRSTNGQIE